jgi:2'-5' RNA ligase superfamily
MTSVIMYRPFIDDPNEIARLEGQRYVVLRPTGLVPDVHCHVRSLIKKRLANCEVSYPAQAHVTLSGFPKGAHLESVRELVAQWARSVAPLRLEVERASYFPNPFQIVTVQVRKTTELFEASACLRAWGKQRRLGDLAKVPPADWIFHMSVAYCTSLSGPAWSAVTRFVETLAVPTAQCVVGDVEIVAFDNGQERSGGVFELSAPGVTLASAPEREGAV